MTSTSQDALSHKTPTNSSPNLHNDGLFLPPELLREIARLCEPQTSQTLMTACRGNRAIRTLIKESDVTWAEAGWRRYTVSLKYCWAWAMENFHEEVILAYLPALRQKEQHRALRNAAYYGQEAIVQKVISAQEIQAKVLNCSLIIAAFAKQVNMVKLLVDLGAEDRNPVFHVPTDVRCMQPGRISKCIRGWMRSEPTDAEISSVPLALDFAVIDHPVATVKLLLQPQRYNRAILNGSLATALYHRKDTVPDVLELLLDGGASMPSHLLLDAARAGYSGIVKRCVEAGAIVNVGLFRMCVWGGAAEAVEYLIGVGDFSAELDVSLLTAASESYVDSVKVLLAAGARTDDLWGRSMLADIVRRNVPIEIVKLLVHAGANVHAHHDLPLQTAAWSGHAEAVKVLIDGGADVHANNNKSIQTAAWRNHLPVVETLLQNGADPLARDQYERSYKPGSALFNAAQRGHIEIIKYFYESGVDVYVEDNYVLYLAVKFGHEELVEWFLEDWMDVQEAVAVARMYGREEILWLLLEHKGAQMEEWYYGSEGCDGGSGEEEEL
ncbi:hypothetical protein HDV00_009741 [Rhizophlyctis rosea]|nr:hypothetical protein HDV00_009741 [Rhizophlyctis rosea]